MRGSCLDRAPAAPSCVPICFLTAGDNDGLPIYLDKIAEGEETPLMCIKHFGNLSLSQVGAWGQTNKGPHLIICCPSANLQLDLA